jgi:hypothetical protein
MAIMTTLTTSFLFHVHSSPFPPTQSDVPLTFLDVVASVPDRTVTDALAPFLLALPLVASDQALKNRRRSHCLASMMTCCCCLCWKGMCQLIHTLPS